MKTVTMKNTVKNGPVRITTEYKKIERESGGPVDRAGMQQLTGVLRDLKAILDVRSELDRQEQEARIEALRAKYEDEDDDEDFDDEEDEDEAEYDDEEDDDEE